MVLLNITECLDTLKNMSVRNQKKWKTQNVGTGSLWSIPRSRPIQDAFYSRSTRRLIMKFIKIWWTLKTRVRQLSWTFAILMISEIWNQPKIGHRTIFLCGRSFVINTEPTTLWLCKMCATWKNSKLHDGGLYSKARINPTLPTKNSESTDNMMCC